MSAFKEDLAFCSRKIALTIISGVILHWSPSAALRTELQKQKPLYRSINICFGNLKTPKAKVKKTTLPQIFKKT